jgi:hypothetical protein
VIFRPVRSRVPDPLHLRHGRQFFPDGDRFRPPPPHRRHDVYGQNQHTNQYTGPPTTTAPTTQAIISAVLKTAS